MTLPDDLTPETLKQLYCETQDDECALLAHASAWTADRKHIEALERDYHELIYAVATEYEGETRHQTALRYITEREVRGMDVRVIYLRGEEER